VKAIVGERNDREIFDDRSQILIALLIANRGGGGGGSWNDAVLRVPSGRIGDDECEQDRREKTDEEEQHHGGANNRVERYRVPAAGTRRLTRRRSAGRMMKRGCIVIAVFAVLISGYVVVWRGLARSEVISHPSRCINNLRRLDGAKRQWAIANNKLETDIPAPADLEPYLEHGWTSVVCQAGGTYHIRAVGQYPRCSLGKADWRGWKPTRTKRCLGIWWIPDYSDHPGGHSMETEREIADRDRDAPRGAPLPHH